METAAYDLRPEDGAAPRLAVSARRGRRARGRGGRRSTSRCACSRPTGRGSSGANDFHDPATCSAVNDVLREAARAEVMPRFRNLASGAVRMKTGPLDLVTEADEAAEAAIEAGLRARFPGCLVVGEEAAVRRSRRCWRPCRGADLAFVVDPIDGTANFAAGLPLFGGDGRRADPRHGRRRGDPGSGGRRHGARAARRGGLDRDGRGTADRSAGRGARRRSRR